MIVDRNMRRKKEIKLFPLKQRRLIYETAHARILKESFVGPRSRYPVERVFYKATTVKKKVYEIRHLLKRRLKSMEDNVVHFIFFFHFIPKCDLFSINIYYIIKALS